MKTHSIIIVCLTLGIFYGLAIKLEHEKKSAHYSNELHSTSVVHSEKVQKTVKYKHCSSSFKQHYTEHSDGVYYDHHDDFSMQVTGKENRYLQTGISFIESNADSTPMNEVAMNVSHP